MSLNAFDSACLVEAESRKIIEPLLELHTDGRLVYTDKGRLAKEFQRKYGDALINYGEGREIFSLEMKAERKATGNLFLEIWSNGSRLTPGWMHHSEADLLFYHFIDSDDLYIAKMQPLRRWFWLGEGPVRKNGERMVHRPAVARFEMKKQKAYMQRNDTHGCIVPATVIRREVGLRLVNPLGLFGMGEVA